MAGEFTIPSSVKPARTGQLANPDEYNQNIAAQSQGRLLAIDEDGAYEDNFDIGDQTVGSTGSLVQYIRLREGGALKIYDSSGVFVQDVNLGQATESVIGQAEIATQSETNAGTDDTKFITPLKLKRTDLSSLQKIAEQSVSGYSITFTDLDDFESYLFIFEQVITGTNSVAIQAVVSTDNGSSFKTGASDYRWVIHNITDASENNVQGSGGDSKMCITSNGSGFQMKNGNFGYNGMIALNNLTSSSQEFTIEVLRATYQNSGGSRLSSVAGSGNYQSNAAVNAIKFQLSAGSFSSGTIRVYGIK